MTEPDFDPDTVDPADLAESEALEQAVPIDPISLPQSVHLSLEVDEADALDQAREVDLGDDDED